MLNNIIHSHCHNNNDIHHVQTVQAYALCHISVTSMHIQLLLYLHRLCQVFTDDASHTKK